MVFPCKGSRSWAFNNISWFWLLVEESSTNHDTGCASFCQRVTQQHTPMERSAARTRQRARTKQYGGRTHTGKNPNQLHKKLAATTKRVQSLGKTKSDCSVHLSTRTSKSRSVVRGSRRIITVPLLVIHGQRQVRLRAKVSRSNSTTLLSTALCRRINVPTCNISNPFWCEEGKLEVQLVAALLRFQVAPKVLDLRYASKTPLRPVLVVEHALDLCVLGRDFIEAQSTFEPDFKTKVLRLNTLSVPFKLAPKCPFTQTWEETSVMKEIQWKNALNAFSETWGWTYDSTSRDASVLSWTRRLKKEKQRVSFWPQNNSCCVVFYHPNRGCTKVSRDEASMSFVHQLFSQPKAIVARHCGRSTDATSQAECSRKTENQRQSRPRRCFKCRCFGHEVRNCPKLREKKLYSNSRDGDGEYTKQWKGSIIEGGYMVVNS